MLNERQIARSPKAHITHERAAIIDRARKIRSEIERLFAYAEHWNRVHVLLKGEPIDPDPDGKLRRLADGIDRMLARGVSPKAPGMADSRKWDGT